MADLHPTTELVSTLPTNPPLNTTAVFRKQPKFLGQLGLATSYSSNGEDFSFTTKPNYYQLAMWDDARRKEPIIKQGIEYIQQAVLAKVGAYSHPDNQIDDFVQSNIEANLKRWLSDIIIPTLWCGNGVSEINWIKKLGPRDIPQIWIDDMVNYHPLQIHFHLNNYGLLKDGDKVVGSHYKSGIWVPMPNNTFLQGSYGRNKEVVGNLVRLPRGKRVYLVLGGEGNNPYGRSILEPVISYHLFKEAYRDMMTVALDRYGTPLIYAVVPPLDTKATVEEPDGTIRPKTLHEVTVEEMQNLSSETALVFTQVNENQPIKLEALTTGNNFSDSFIQAIDLCDHNMMTGLGIPNLLMRDTSSRLGTGGASERQLELFDSYISSIFDLTVIPFINQAISQLIQYNFDPRLNPKAYLAGTIQKKPTRYTELRTVVDAIKELTMHGYINPANDIDFRYVRELVGLPERSISSEDFTVIFPDRRQERININHTTTVDGDIKPLPIDDKKIVPTKPQAA